MNDVEKIGYNWNFYAYALIVGLFVVLGTLVTGGNVLDVVVFLTIGLIISPLSSFLLGCVEGNITKDYGEAAFRGTVLGLFGTILILISIFFIIQYGPEGGYEVVRDTIDEVILVYFITPQFELYEQVILLISILSISTGLFGGYTGRYLTTLFTVER